MPREQRPSWQLAALQVGANVLCAERKHWDRVLVPGLFPSYSITNRR